MQQHLPTKQNRVGKKKTTRSTRFVRTMPTTVEANWADKPCLFRLPSENADVCGHCEESFTFWNGRRHCEFCGYLFHRVGCIRKCKVDGEFFSRSICVRCEFYRNVAAKTLREGGEFVCFRKGRLTTVNISLSEDTGELVFYWPSQGISEALDLLGVEVRKGFSHAGHMRTTDYDALKSLSLQVKRGSLVSTVDLKAPSAWLCQLWVEGVNAARYIHRRQLEQQEALEWCNERGEKVHEIDRWFKTNYLPSRKYRGNRNRSKSSPVRARRSASSSMSSGVSVGSNHSDEFEELELPSDHTTLSSSTCPSSHESTPSPQCREKRAHTVPTSQPKSIDTNDRSCQSTPGLPYKQSPFHSLCGCHAYEITPPRSVSPVEEDHSRHQQEQTCCPECELICKIALDLSNL